MIKSSVIKFGQLFPDAITIVDRVGVQREPKSANGYIVVAKTMTWASKSAMDNNEEHIHTASYIFTDIPMPAKSPNMLDLKPLIADDKTGLQITDDIEEILLTLPVFAGGTAL